MLRKFRNSTLSDDFSYVSWDLQELRMFYHSDCKDEVWSSHESFCDSRGWRRLWNTCHKCCICEVSPQCGFFCECSNWSWCWTSCCRSHRHRVALQCVFSCVSLTSWVCQTSYHKYCRATISWKHICSSSSSPPSPLLHPMLPPPSTPPPHQLTCLISLCWHHS